MTNNVLPTVKFFKARYRASIDVGPLGSVTGPFCTPLGTQSTVTKLNSIYDPNNNTSGTFNEVASYHNFYQKFYHNYYVYKTVISYTIRPDLSMVMPGIPPDPDVPLSFDKIPFKWGVYVDDDGSGTGLTSRTWQQMAGNPTGKWKTFAYGGKGADGSGKSKITLTWRASDTKKSNDKSAHSAEFGTNPLELYYAVPWIAAPNDSWSVQYFGYHVEIMATYYVVASDMKDWSNIADEEGMAQT